MKAVLTLPSGLLRKSFLSFAVRGALLGKFISYWIKWKDWNEGQIWSVLISTTWLASCMTLANLLNYTEPFFICKHILLFLVNTRVALVGPFKPAQEVVGRIWCGSKNKNNYPARPPGSCHCEVVKSEFAFLSFKGCVSWHHYLTFLAVVFPSPSCLGLYSICSLWWLSLPCLLYIMVASFSFLISLFWFLRVSTLFPASYIWHIQHMVAVQSGV